MPVKYLFAMVTLLSLNKQSILSLMRPFLVSGSEWQQVVEEWMKEDIPHLIWYWHLGLLLVSFFPLSLMHKCHDNVIVSFLPPFSFHSNIIHKLQITITQTIVLPEDALAFSILVRFHKSFHQNKLRIYHIEFREIMKSI